MIKTAKIMSRYRPIAPKPQPPSLFPSNLCPNFPNRTRKRSRPSLISPHAVKRSRLSLLPRPSLQRAAADYEIPRERDLLHQLQAPTSTCTVITPHPVRPVGSIIRVGCINVTGPARTTLRKADEVEREVESEMLPAVVSDSNNRVRMANSAYKEMVGQPECPWLDSMVTGDRRIGGEVTLQLSDAAAVVRSSNGFSCWARIDWRNGEGKDNSIVAFCDVVKLCCVSRDYLFTWRFHTRNRDDRNDVVSNSICINVS